MVNIELDENTYTFLLRMVNMRYARTDDLSEKSQLNTLYKALKFRAESWLSPIHEADKMEEK